MNDKHDINLIELIEKETGDKFSKDNKVKCPIHGDTDPSLSVKNDGSMWKCYGCGRSGDSIDFIRYLKGITYIEACKYLGIAIDEKLEVACKNMDKIKGYISWQINKIDDMKSWKLAKIYEFVNDNNDVMYYKGKFNTAKGKEFRYYHIENGKVVGTRGIDEIPYNLYSVKRAIADGKGIFILEGEKDADTVNSWGYKATSCKGVKDFSHFRGANIYLCGDSGQAGEQYIKDLIKELNPIANGLHKIELRGIDTLGDNADITDLVNNKAYSKEDFKRDIQDSWNLKKSMLWRYTKEITRNNDTITIPLKVWENLDVLLKREGVALKYNVISKEIESNISSSVNIALTDIYSLQVRRGLNMSREDVYNSMIKVANKNQYNPFVEYLKKYKNTNYTVINEVFSCIEINNDYKCNADKYLKYFKKWLLNVVKMAHNSLELSYTSQGILVLQGEQGCRKSTFCRKLLPNSKWFIGDMTLDPSKVDSVIQNTSHVLVELGELDSTLKAEQSKLKAFITAPRDVYRAPYDRAKEQYPRRTSYIATVNQYDFIKDKTGSRRFWIIPVNKIDTEKMDLIDLNEFWGAVYGIWESGTMTDYLNDEEIREITKDNMSFAAESDISITLDESFDWESDDFEIYGIKRLCELLDIKEKKALKNELERRGFKYQTHRGIAGEVRKGYKLPRLNMRELLNVVR